MLIASPDELQGRMSTTHPNSLLSELRPKVEAREPYLDVNASFMRSRYANTISRVTSCSASTMYAAEAKQEKTT